MPRIEVELASVPKDTPHRLEYNGMGIVVIRSGHNIHAYHDVCPHASWRLSDGEVVNGILECPGHGWQFDVTSSRYASVPAYCLKPVSITVLGEIVRLEWIEPVCVPVRSRSLHGEASA